MRNTRVTHNDFREYSKHALGLLVEVGSAAVLALIAFLFGLVFWLIYRGPS